MFRDYRKYKEEIELALIQNACVEIELYSIIANIIRESANGKAISLRDVSNRRTSEISKRFKGNSGFPDFVVLERKMDSNAKIYGCIEAKMPTKPLEVNDGQIKGHIETFNKVLYTNGIRWILLEKDKEKASLDIVLGSMEEGKISWESEENWNKLISEIDKIKWTRDLKEMEAGR